MAEHGAGHGRQKLAAVAPLILVIAASLIWSGYATYHHAIDATAPIDGSGKVPGQIAWTLIVALDGTVVVTTPIWLSTVLPPRARNYAAVICVLALGGSMLINYAETGWPGVFPPLIAGALIHLVGVVLRAFARIEESPVESSAADAESELVHADESANTDAPQTPAGPGAVPVTSTPPATRTVLADSDPEADVPMTETPSELDRPEPATAADLVRRILGSAYATGRALPGGAELTAACQKAGFDVNPNYGRSARARWIEKHPMAREDVTV